MNTQPKKRGRPVGSKTIKKVQKSLEEMNTSQKEIMDKIYKVHAENWQKQWDNVPDSEATVEHVKDWSRYDMSKKKYDTVKIKELDEMSLVNKITWVLTAVNVAILISLVIKNV